MSDLSRYTPIDRLWVEPTAHGTMMMLSCSDLNFEIREPLYVPLANMTGTPGFLKFVWAGLWERKALFRADAMVTEAPEGAQIRQIAFH